MQGKNKKSPNKNYNIGKELKHMINPKQKEIHQQSEVAITDALQARIPGLQIIHVDDNPHMISQADIFGNVDTILHFGSPRLYMNQNKSRCDNKQDICFECRSFRGKPESLITGQKVPINGAYWYEPGKCWLAPRFNEIDTMTIHLPGCNWTGHFNRYYLDIMFASKDTWSHATGFFKINDDSDTYIVFFDHKDFTDLYLQTVAKTATGEDCAFILESELVDAKEWLKRGNTNGNTDEGN